MKSSKNVGRGSSLRERRVFTAEFKAEAVRLFLARRTSGRSAAQVGRELGVLSVLISNCTEVPIEIAQSVCPSVSA